MVRAMDSPMPMPSALLVKNGSNTSFSLSSGMPGPRSDTDSSANLFDSRSPDADDAVFGRRILHRVDPVHDKVENDLLKLDAVAEDRKRIRCDHANQFDVSPDGQRRKKFDGVANEVIEVEIFQFEGCFFQQAAHSSNNFGGAPVILQNILHDILEFSDVGRRRLSGCRPRFRRWSE